jgi:hypothetical protein
MEARPRYMVASAVCSAIASVEDMHSGGTQSDSKTGVSAMSPYWIGIVIRSLIACLFVLYPAHLR